MQAPFSTMDFHRSPSSKVAMKARFRAKFSGSLEYCTDDHFPSLSLWLGKQVTITPLQHCVAGKEKGFQVLQ